jgi:hypothetical protein
LNTGKITKAIVEKDDLIKAYGWLNKTALLYSG